MEDCTITNSSKKCGRCQVSKSFQEFNKNKNAKFGLNGHCRSCQKEIKQVWDSKNREHIKEYYSNPENIKRARDLYKKRYDSDPIFREKELEKNRTRRRTDDAKTVARKQRKEWYKIPKNRIACSLRVRIRLALKGKSKSARTEYLTGCTFSELKEFLESKFSPNMNWDNYGEWHIDHIKPLSSFDLSKEEELLKACHYTNLQPLWAIDNKKKGNKEIVSV